MIDPHVDDPTIWIKDRAILWFSECENDPESSSCKQRWREPKDDGGVIKGPICSYNAAVRENMNVCRSENATADSTADGNLCAWTEPCKRVTLGDEITLIEDNREAVSESYYKVKKGVFTEDKPCPGTIAYYSDNKTVRGRERNTEEWTTYVSANDAARQLDLKQGNITAVLQKRYTHTGNYEFEYAEPNEPECLEGEEWRDIEVSEL